MCLRRGSIILTLFFATLQAFAAGAHRVVIDMDVSGKAPLANVLGMATNLRKAFSPAAVEIEIVCHGPGLDLVLGSHNSLAPRIGKLQAQGVVFAACANTMKGRKVVKVQLVPGVVVVDAGAAELVRRQEAGWAYLKSG